MKILHCVESYSPQVNGMQTVVQQLSERLVSMGHEVTVATTKLSRRTYHEINGVQIIEFDISGNFVRGLEGEVDRYKDFLLNSNFDIVTAFAAQQWATDILLPILGLINAKKVFVPTGFSGLFEPSYTGYFEQMKSWIKYFDANVFLSNKYRDVNFARENNLKDIFIIPNGADEKEFLSKNFIDIKDRYQIPQKNKLIILVGGHTGHKGHEEAIEIFSKSKIKDTTLFLIAHPVPFGGCEMHCKAKADSFNSEKNNKINGKQILVDFPSRVETVAAYKSADLFLFPSNIECSPLVIFEAMAAGVPFLATDVGNISEIIEWSKGGVLLPTIKSESEMSYAQIDESVKVFEDLINDKEKLAELGRNGFDAWEKSYKWEKIAQDYEDLYQSLLRREERRGLNNISFDIIFEVYNLSDLKMILPYSSIQGIQNVIILNNRNLDIPQEVIQGNFKLIKNLYDKNLLLNDLKGDLAIFIDCLNPLSVDSVKLMLDKAKDKEIGMIYTNYSSIKRNREYRNRFSMLELDYDDHGLIFTKLTEKNKINSKLSNILIRRELISSVGGFNASFGSMQDWDMILKIAKISKIDYIFEYTSIPNLENYYNSDFSESRFKDETRFINSWINELGSKAAKIWGNYVGWKIKMVFPSNSLLKIAEKNLTAETNRLLFKQTLGSLKLYLILTYVVGIAKALIDRFINSAKDVIRALHHSILIIFS